MNHVSHLPADPFLVAVYLQVVLLDAGPLQTATNSMPKEMVQNNSISVHKLSCIDHIFMTLLAVFFALFSLLLQMFCSVQCGKISPTPTGSAVWITCLTFQPIRSWWPCIYNLCCWVLALYRLLRTALPKEMVQNVSISVHQLSCIDHIFMTLLAVFFALFSLLLQMFCSVQCGKISPTPTGSAVWITCLTFQPIRSWWPCIYKLCCWVLAVYVSHLPADPFLLAVYLQVVLLGASPLQTATNSIA